MKSWVVKAKRFGRRRCRFTCTTPDPDVHTNCACTCNINVIPPDGEKSIRYTRYWKPRLLHWIGNWNNDELGHAVRFSGRRRWREIRTLTDLLLRNSLLSLFFSFFAGWTVEAKSFNSNIRMQDMHARRSSRKGVCAFICRRGVVTHARNIEISRSLLPRRYEKSKKGIEKRWSRKKERK